MLGFGIVFIAASWLNVTVLERIEDIHVGLEVSHCSATRSEVCGVSRGALETLAFIDVEVVTVLLFLGNLSAVSNSVEIHSLRSQLTTHVVG